MLNDYGKPGVLMEKTKVVIVAPSLDTSVNVSGVSAVTSFIIQNNRQREPINQDGNRTYLWLPM